MTLHNSWTDRSLTGQLAAQVTLASISTYVQMACMSTHYMQEYQGHKQGLETGLQICLPLCTYAEAIKVDSCLTPFQLSWVYSAVNTDRIITNLFSSENIKGKECHFIPHNLGWSKSRLFDLSCVATHGTGVDFGNLATYVTKLELISGRGEVSLKYSLGRDSQEHEVMS